MNGGVFKTVPSILTLEYSPTQIVVYRQDHASSYLIKPNAFCYKWYMAEEIYK